MGVHTHRYIRFVSIHRRILIWLERRLSASRVERAWSRERYSESELYIQIGLAPRMTLIIRAAFTLEGSIELVIISEKTNKRE